MGARDEKDPRSLYHRWSVDSDAMAKELKKRLIQKAKEKSAGKEKTGK